MEDKTALQVLERLETDMSKRMDTLAEAQDVLAEEIRERGGPSQETKETVSTMESELKSLTETVEELKEIAPDLVEFKNKMERPGGPGGTKMSPPGHRFADSPEYKTWKDNKLEKSSPMELGSMDNLLPERKALTNDEGVWGGAGVLIEPMLLPGILTQPQREIRFRDLVNVQQVNTDSVRYYKETGYANLYAVVAANAASGQANVQLSTAGDNTGVAGFFAGQTISVAGQTRVIQSINSSTNTLTLTTNLTTLVNAGAEVVSDQLGGTPHGGTKPQSSIKFDDESASIITIAHWIAAHRQTLADLPQLQGTINARLLYGLDMAVEDQALYGTGTSTTLLGIMNTPGVQDQGTRTGNDPNGNPWTQIDWLRKAFTKAQVAQYPVNGIMVNPLDWEAIELAKDDTGRYLWMSITDNGVRRLFGVPVVVTTAVRSGQFLCGAFGLGATLFDRQEANIRISDSHASFFIQNALAILAELRLGLALQRPESFVKGAF